MRRSPFTLPVVAALLGATLTCLGCAGNAKYLTEDRLNNGLIIILPGIEGHSQINENIRHGLVAAGVDRAIPIYEWGRPVPLFGPLINQVDFLGNRLAGERMAKRVVEYQDKYPGRPVYIIGHSGGGGIAVFTAEAMPEGRQLDGLVLLSASISSGYDLTKALAHCREGIVNFYNKGDAGVLGVGTVVLGTVDGTHGLSAGLVGFDDFDKPGYEGLYQVRMENVATDSHTTSTQVGFVANYVAPWVVAGGWPAGPGDILVDRMPKTRPAGATPVASSGVIENVTAAGPAEHVTPKLASTAKPGKAVAASAKSAGATTRPAAATGKVRLAAKEPAHVHPTISPRLPTDETAQPDVSPDDDGLAEMLPPPADPANEADPATIAPDLPENPASKPKSNPRYKRW